MWSMFDGFLWFVGMCVFGCFAFWAAIGLIGMAVMILMETIDRWSRG